MPTLQIFKTKVSIVTLSNIRVLSRNVNMKSCTSVCKCGRSKSIKVWIGTETCRRCYSLQFRYLAWCQTFQRCVFGNETCLYWTVVGAWTRFEEQWRLLYWCFCDSCFTYLNDTLSDVNDSAPWLSLNPVSFESQPMTQITQGVASVSVDGCFTFNVQSHC